MEQYHLKYYFSIIISLYCLLPILPVVLADCDKCEALPPDCQQGHGTPFSGGPSCTCTSTQQPQGCILKPCEFVNDDSICDCSNSTGSIKTRQFCRKYRCTGESGECQSCKNLPPDCTPSSYNNPPANGGPECSCTNQVAPGGCTMKPCAQGKLTPDPCVSKPGGPSSVVLYGSTCPGNWNISGGGNNGGASVAGWVLTGVGGAVLTFGIVLLGLSRVTGGMSLVTVGMAMLFGALGIILLVIGVVLLGVGLWLVFN